MTRSNVPRNAGALLCFLLADGVAAHPRPPQVLDGVRLVGTVDAVADADAYQVGKRLLASGDVVAALAAFRQALAASPGSADAMNGIGVCYDGLARPDLARQFYEAGLAIDPASPQLLNNLGYSRFLAGDGAGAVAPLRAAAASPDPDAAAAAAATLAALAASPRSSTAADMPVPRAEARVEPTSDGEQRLTFAPAAPAPQLGDAATLVEATPDWTPADDAVLTARVAAAEAAEAAAAAAANDAAAAQLAMASAAETAPPPAVAAPLAPAAPVVAPVRLASALVVNASDSRASALRRRGTSGPRSASTAIGDGPRQREPVPFDSDDAELNAFAARVGIDAAVAQLALPAEPTRIAARFRV